MYTVCRLIWVGTVCRLTWVVTVYRLTWVDTVFRLTWVGTVYRLTWVDTVCSFVIYIGKWQVFCVTIMLVDCEVCEKIA